jgi:hypothetical protein
MFWILQKDPEVVAVNREPAAEAAELHAVGSLEGPHHAAGSGARRSYQVRSRCWRRQLSPQRRRHG